MKYFWQLNSLKTYEMLTFVFFIKKTMWCCVCHFSRIQFFSVCWKVAVSVLAVLGLFVVWVDRIAAARVTLNNFMWFLLLSGETLKQSWLGIISIFYFFVYSTICILWALQFIMCGIWHWKQFSYFHLSNWGNDTKIGNWGKMTLSPSYVRNSLGTIINNYCFIFSTLRVSLM